MLPGQHGQAAKRHCGASGQSSGFWRSATDALADDGLLLAFIGRWTPGAMASLSPVRALWDRKVVLFFAV